MRMLSVCAAAMIAAAGLASTAKAGEVFGGVYAHDLGPAHREPDAADFMLGYRTDRLGGIFKYIGSPHFHIFGSVDSYYPTDFIAIGFDYRLTPHTLYSPIPEGLYIRPGIGFAGTTGKAGLPAGNNPALTDAQRQAQTAFNHRHIDFGSRDLFEPELAFGYQINPKLSAEISWVHLSNGQILHSGVNEGLDDVGLRINYRFGAP